MVAVRTRPLYLEALVRNSLNHGGITRTDDANRENGREELREGRRFSPHRKTTDSWRGFQNHPTTRTDRVRPISEPLSTTFRYSVESRRSRNIIEISRAVESRQKHDLSYNGLSAVQFRIP